MKIITPDADELRRLTGSNDDEAIYQLDPVPPDVNTRLYELSKLYPDATVILGRDWERCIFGIVEGVETLDVLVFSDGGWVGHGGINHPVYFATFAELVEQ